MSQEAVVVQLDVIEHDSGVYYLTCQSPFGETNFRLDLPRLAGDLDAQLRAVETNVLRSGAQLITRGAAGRLEAPIRQLGTDLCDAVLRDESRELFETSVRHAEKSRLPFQLMLRIRGNTLAQLPWEFLYDRRRGDYLALNLPVVRYLEVMQPVAPVTVKLPLRILGVVSHPDDRDDLQVTAEKEALSAALAPLGESHVQLHWLDGSGWEHLWRAARGQEWHILHFIGHGGFDEAHGEGFLEFVNDSGAAQHVYATDLARLLHDNASLRLAVLNACESGRAAGTDRFGSPAASLIRRGFSAAVAMQYEISDPAALVFAQAFYGAIAAGEPLDRAVTDARTTVHMTQPESLEWGTPVLYLRSRDTNVFEVKEASPPPVPPGPPVITQSSLSRTGIDGLRRANELVRSLAAPKAPGAVGTATVRGAAPRRTGKVLVRTHRFRHPGPVHAVAVDPYARRLLAAGESGEILSWDLDQARVARCCRLAEHPGPVRSLAVTRDGRFAAAVHSDRVVRVWDVATEVVALSLRPPAGLVPRSVRYSPDNTLVVIGFSGGIAQVADRYGTERLRLVHHGQAGDVHSASFSPDGRWIATGADDGQLRLFGPNGQVAAAFPHPRAVLDVAFRPDGRLLASGCADGAARLWNPGGELRTRLKHGAAVSTVAFGPGGLLATGGPDGHARVWSPDGHPPPSGPDGHARASGREWRDDDGPEAWTEAAGPVTAVACWPNRPLTLATGHADHTVEVWTQPPGEGHE